MFKGNIGVRTGRNVLEGKEIHCDSAGFDNFDNYFTDSASSSQEKTPETVRQNSIKSFLNSEKSVHDGDSPLSKLPSKKRLSFKADAASDSDSSSIASFQPRNRLISKRGMQSFPEDEDDEKRYLEQFSSHTVTIKSYSPTNKCYILHSPTKKEYSKRISKRGMKSFPDDDDDDEDDGTVYEIPTSPDDDDDDGAVYEIPTIPGYLSSQPIVKEKIFEDDEDPGKIQLDENIDRLSQKSSSSPSIIVIPKSREKAPKNMPVQKWYIWEDSSLADGAKIIITPYGVHEDTGVKNNFQNLGTNLQLIDEEESQLPSQKNWKPKKSSLGSTNIELSGASSEEDPQEKTKSSNEKQTKTLPQRKSAVKQKLKQPQGLSFSTISANKEPPEDSSEVDVLVTDEATLVKKKSLPKPANKLEDEMVFTDMTTTTDDESQRFKSKKNVLVPKLRVSPRRQRTYQRTKSHSTGQKQSSSAKENLGSVNRKSLPAEEKRKSTTSLPRNKQALTVSKKKPSPSQNKKNIFSPKEKRTRSVRKASPPPPENKPNTRNRKRHASRSPEVKVPAKRHKVNDKPTTTTPTYWTRSSASKVQKENISNDKKQKKIISQKADEAKTKSEQCLSVSPSCKIMPPPRIIPSVTGEDLPANCNLLQSKTENSQAISHGFNSPSRNLRHKETTINSKGSNKINSSKNSNERIDIVDVFDSRELNPKLDKTNEKNKKLSSHYHLNEEDESSTALQKLVQKKRSSPSPVTLPRTRRRSGPLSSEDSVIFYNEAEQRSGRLSEADSLVAFSKGFSKRISAEKSKTPTKVNHVSNNTKKGNAKCEDLNVSNFNFYEDPPDWLCLNCNGLIPQCLMTCIFCGSRRHSSQEDSIESESDSQEETTNWQCQGCDALIPVSLEACIFCDLSKQEGSQGKNKKHSSQKLKEKPQKGKKPVGGTSKPESPVIQKPKSMKSSFSLKNSYTFKSYTSIKVDHKISYCVCSESDTAMVGMMKLGKGGYRSLNWSLKEMFFTVLEGKVKVQIDNEKQVLSTRDTFVVATNGEYSIENATAKTASLIFTIIK